jgi:serine/threonine protein kinase
MALTQGDRFGRYEILAPLGAGGMGEVYRAKDTELDREVAVKVIPEAVAGDEARLARFKAEARAVAALSHPNILEIYDVGSENGVHFAVTELLEGQTLRERVPTSGLPWQKMVEMGAGIADGLAAAHGKRIVHRDLKPENVFVTADGRVKVLDFGLAKIHDELSPEAETGTLTPAGTLEGTILGTVGYMAPEQVKGKSADHRSDIFALGCVLYEMVSGRRAFGGDTAVEVMAAILKKEPQQLASSGATLPADLERTIHRCLEKSPEARFQSAADLAFSLRSIGTGSPPVMATPTGELRPAGRSGLRWPVVAAASALVIAVSGIIGWQQLRPSQEPLPEVEPVSEPAPTPFIDEWVVTVEPFQNRTADASLEAVGPSLADRMVDNLGRLTQGLQGLPAVSVVVADEGAHDLAGGGAPPPQTQGRILVTGSYTARDTDLEVVARVRDRDSRRVLYATEPFQVPRQPRADTLRPLLEKVKGAVGVHISLGLEHESHVPDYQVFHEFFMGWKELAADELDGIDRIDQALQADPEYLRPAYVLASASLNMNRPDEAPPYLDHIRQRSHRLTEFESRELEVLEAWVTGSSGQALRAARRLQELAPTYTPVRFYRARFAAALNRPGEVVSAAADIVDRLQQWSWLHNSLMAAYERLGDYAQLLEMARQWRSQAPAHSRALSTESNALIGLGRVDELDALVEECRAVPGGECDVALVLASASMHLAVHGHRQKSIEYARDATGLMESLPEDELRRRDPVFILALRRAEQWDEYADYARQRAEGIEDGSERDGYYLGCVGIAAAHRGDRTTAEAVIDRLVDRKELTYAGYVAGSLGDLDRSFEYLKRGIEAQGGWTYQGIMRWDPDFEPLWGYEPFEEIIRPKG